MLGHLFLISPFHPEELQVGEGGSCEHYFHSLPVGKFPSFWCMEICFLHAQNGVTCSVVTSSTDFLNIATISHSVLIFGGFLPSLILATHLINYDDRWLHSFERNNSVAYILASSSGTKITLPSRIISRYVKHQLFLMHPKYTCTFLDSNFIFSYILIV